MKETAIQALDSSSLIIVNPDAAFMQTVQENMEGVTPRFERIKIPSGGGLAFEIPTEDAKPEVSGEIVGVIVDHYRVNAYWPDKFSGGNNPPVCSALDGMNGVCAEEGLVLGGPCAKCHMNQWGSDHDKDGAATRGKACKNIHRLYIVRPGQFYPDQVALPPTSLKNLDAYLQRLTSKGIPFYAVISKVELTKDRNVGGIEYSKATFSRVKDLSKEEVAAIRRYIHGDEANKVVGIKKLTRLQAIEAADYNTEEATAAKAPEVEPF